MAGNPIHFEDCTSKDLSIWTHGIPFFYSTLCFVPVLAWLIGAGSEIKNALESLYEDVHKLLFSSNVCYVCLSFLMSVTNQSFVIFTGMML